MVYAFTKCDYYRLIIDSENPRGILPVLLNPEGDKNYEKGYLPLVKGFHAEKENIQSFIERAQVQIPAQSPKYALTNEKILL